MTKFCIPFLFIFASVLVATAREPITVDRVDFNSTRDNWVQVEIQLKCNGNSLPEARDRRFVENIKVKIYLTYELKNAEAEFDFYTSEVEIVIMEQGDDNNVYFYLPGLIVERDKLSKTNPDYYFVDIYINDVLQPQQDSARSSRLSSEVALSMKTKAEAEGDKNAHILMPVYYAPVQYLGQIEDLPVFLRRDVRE